MPSQGGAARGQSPQGPPCYATDHQSPTTGGPTLSLLRVFYSGSRPVTSLWHQGGKKFSGRASTFFKLCPIILNYVQHIFPGGSKNLPGKKASGAPLSYGPVSETLKPRVSGNLSISWEWKQQSFHKFGNGNRNITSRTGKEHELAEEELLTGCCWHLFEQASWFSHCGDMRWVKTLVLRALIPEC